MNDNIELINQIQKLSKQLDNIESELEDIKNNKFYRERPLNFWEFLLKVEWFQVCGFILVLTYFLSK